MTHKEQIYDWLSDHIEETATEFVDYLESLHADTDIPQGHTEQDVQTALDLWHTWSYEYANDSLRGDL